MKSTPSESEHAFRRACNNYLRDRASVSLGRSDLLVETDVVVDLLVGHLPLTELGLLDGLVELPLDTHDSPEDAPALVDWTGEDNVNEIAPTMDPLQNEPIRSQNLKLRKQALIPLAPDLVKPPELIFSVAHSHELHFGKTWRRFDEKRIILGHTQPFLAAYSRKYNLDS